MKRPVPLDRRADKSASDVRHVIKHIIESTPPSRLFEIYYWAQEPELLKIFRGMATLSAANKQAIASFFELAQGRASITATWAPGGVLILEVRHAPDEVAAFAHLLDDDDDTPPDQASN